MSECGFLSQSKLSVCLSENSHRRFVTVAWQTSTRSQIATHTRATTALTAGRRRTSTARFASRTAERPSPLHAAAQPLAVASASPSTLPRSSRSTACAARLPSVRQNRLGSRRGANAPARPMPLMAAQHLASQTSERHWHCSRRMGSAAQVRTGCVGHGMGEAGRRAPWLACGRTCAAAEKWSRYPKQL